MPVSSKLFVLKLCAHTRNRLVIGRLLLEYVLRDAIRQAYLVGSFVEKSLLQQGLFLYSRE